MSYEPQVHYVVVHLPGEKYQHGVDFREQPKVMGHVQHYARWLEEGKLLMGGPFLPPFEGGMMIAQAEISEEELTAYASADPAVADGLLRFEVRPWYVPMRAE